MAKAFICVTRLMLLAGFVSGIVIGQSSAALAQKPGKTLKVPYVVPASCSNETDATVVIHNNQLLIREMGTRQDPHPVCGFDIFNSDPGIHDGDTSPSARTSLPMGIYSFDLTGVTANDHLVLKLATIEKSGKISNMHELKIPTNGTVVYRVPEASSAPRATSNSTAAASSAATTSIVAAGEDEVSAAIAALFGQYGANFQALSLQASNFNGEFVQVLSSSADFYAAGEAAGATYAAGNARSAAKISTSGRSIPLGIDATHTDVHSPNSPFSWCADH